MIRSMSPEDKPRGNLAAALSQLPVSSHANSVVLELYSIGGQAVLDAVALGISEHPMGRAYLSVHLDAVRRGNADRSWRETLPFWLPYGENLPIFPHSGAMTAIRFMLVQEGFANLVDGNVTIDPMFADALRLVRAAA